MRLQIQSSDLKRIVALAGMPVRRHVMPVMECLHLSAKDNRLTIMGTDLFIEVHATHEAAVSEAGSASVNFADMRAVTSRLTGVVSVRLTDAGLSLECTNAKICLPTLTDDIRRMDGPSGEIEVVGGVDAMHACMPFCSSEDSRPALNGVLFDEDRAVSTNSNRLFSTPCSGGSQQIVPVEAAPIIAKIGGRLFLSELSWRVESEGLMAIGRLVDATYPDWRRLISDGIELYSCEADDLISAIEMATAGRALEAVFTDADGGVNISGDKFAGQHITSECFVAAGGQGGSFLVQAENMLKCLKPFSGGKVILKTSGPAVLVKPENGGSYALVSMLRDARTSLPEAA